MKQIRAPGLAALALLAGLSGAQALGPPVGTWLSQGGEIRVRIAKCATAYCGTIVWEKAPSKDANNPDPALRTRDMVGDEPVVGDVLRQPQLDLVLGSRQRLRAGVRVDDEQVDRVRSDVDDPEAHAANVVAPGHGP